MSVDAVREDFLSGRYNGRIIKRFRRLLWFAAAICKTNTDRSSDRYAKCVAHGKGMKMAAFLLLEHCLIVHSRPLIKLGPGIS